MMSLASVWPVESCLKKIIWVWNDMAGTIPNVKLFNIHSERGSVKHESVSHCQTRTAKKGKKCLTNTMAAPLVYCMVLLFITQGCKHSHHHTTVEILHTTVR